MIRFPEAMPTGVVAERKIHLSMRLTSARHTLRAKTLAGHECCTCMGEGYRCCECGDSPSVQAPVMGTPSVASAQSDFDTSRLPLGTPSGRVGANPFVVGTPSVRTFVLRLNGSTAVETRMEFDSTLPKMVKAVERRIRQVLPATSAFEWAGPGSIGKRWTITALDASRGRLAEYDLHCTGK